jgi:hypothetical protein
LEPEAAAHVVVAADARHEDQRLPINKKGAPLPERLEVDAMRTQ